MAGGGDGAAPKPGVVRNQITDGTVLGPVVQAGAFTGHIHYHYRDERQPLDLPALRSWVDRIRTDYLAMVDDTGDRAGVKHHARIDLMRAGLDDSGPDGELRKDTIRRIVVAGIIGYLAGPGTPPSEPLPEQILLDLIVFSLWPVVTAKKLPPGWQGELAQITSPRLAALVEGARAEHRPSAESFARAVADKSFSSAMARLFDDLADPHRGGALLTAMAVAGGLPAPPVGRREGRRVAAWVLAVAGGAALAEAVGDGDTQAAARVIVDVLANLPIDPSDSFDPVDLGDVIGWLFS